MVDILEVDISIVDFFVDIILLVDIFVSEPSLLLPGSQRPIQTDENQDVFQFTFNLPVGYFPNEVTSRISVLDRLSPY